MLKCLYDVLPDAHLLFSVSQIKLDHFVRNFVLDVPDVPGKAKDSTAGTSTSSAPQAVQQVAA